jgi:hypothetical protein
MLVGAAATVVQTLEHEGGLAEAVLVMQKPQVRRQA